MTQSGFLKKTKGCWILFIFLSIFFGCEEDKEPIVFAEIQLVNVILLDGRIEFLAKLANPGTEEILEYGFLVGNKGSLTIDSGLKISELGKPETYFKHSIIRPQVESLTIYSYRAFIRTKSGYVYSTEANFTYDGRQLTFSNDILVSGEVYFGDTVTLMRPNIKSTVDYEVFFNYEKAAIVEVGSGLLKFTIPDSIHVYHIKEIQDMVEIDLRSADGSEVFERIIKFKDPVFSSSNLEPIDYADMIRIKGENLHDPFLQVYYSPTYVKGSTFELVNSEDTELIVKPTTLFNELDPELTLVIRGKTYKRKDLVRFKPTVVTEDQQYELDIGDINSTILIRGENFNPYYTIPVITPDFLDWKIEESGRDFVKIGFNGFKDLIPQEFKIQFKIREGVLTNPIDVKVISLVKSVAKWENIPGPFTDIGDKLFFAENGYWEVNPATWEKRKIWSYPETHYVYPAGGFFFHLLIGRRVFLGDPGGTMRVQSFNLDTYTLEDYGEVGLFTSPFRVYALNEKLRIDYGIKMYDPDRMELNKSVLEFDPETKVWTELKEGERKSIKREEVRISVNVFSYQNEIYCLSVDPENLSNHQYFLFRLKEGVLDWENLGPLLGDLSEESIAEVFTINDRVFFNTKENWYEFDVRQNSSRKIEGLSAFAYRPKEWFFTKSGFVFENKFYIWKPLKEKGSILLEFDPSLF